MTPPDSSERADWFSLIVGNDGSNVGMLRILGFILAFIIVGGAFVWLIG